MSEPRMGGDAPPRMRWRQRWLVYALVALVGLTGIAWLLASAAADTAKDSAVNTASMARWALVAHGIGAYALLVVLGALWPLHLRAAWRARRNRVSGITMVSVWCLLALSGLWLYYGGVAGREGVSTFHWALGLAAIGVLIVHILLGRRL